MSKINLEHLATRIAQFRDERRALQEMVVACFPIGCRVRVKQTQQTGIVRSTTGSPDLLFVDVDNIDGYRMVISVLDLERVT